MTSVTIQEAQSNLPDLVHKLSPGEELVITEHNKPVAKLISHDPLLERQRRRGSAKGKLVLHAEDEDHLKDFREYGP